MIFMVKHTGSHFARKETVSTSVSFSPMTAILCSVSALNAENLYVFDANFIFDKNYFCTYNYNSAGGASVA